MQQQQGAGGRNRIGSGASFWVALAAALGLHAIILLLPMATQHPAAVNGPDLIELQLSAYSPPAPAPDPVSEPLEPVIEAEELVAEATPPEIQKELPPPVQVPVREEEIAPPAKAERNRVTQSILAARFFTQESEADKLFGKPLVLPDAPTYNRFQQPIGQDMITMLDQPLPDLPFAYTPGLVRFAYDPGVKGDLQRFWDVITPEFGWKTDTGFEVRCIWVLVIAACGWN